SPTNKLKKDSASVWGYSAVRRSRKYFLKEYKFKILLGIWGLVLVILTIFENVKVHEKYMHRCLQLAKNALGNTYPNPMVGCVIVLNGKIIGEGWHQKAGENHAEVNAINSVKDKSLLKKASIYVSLEPCSHFGKT